MPYPNEHALKFKDPNTIDKIRVRRTKGSKGSKVYGVKIPDSISVIWFITKENDKEILVPQSLRFSVDKWTKEQVKSFKSKHDLPGKIELANKEDVAGTIKVFRSDRLPSQRIGSVKKTDEGYLSGIAPVAKIGVMSYLLNDGSIRRELVSEETLFNSDYMETLKMKPVTDSHPVEGAVNSLNAKSRKVGFTGETVKQDGDYLTVNLTITDNDSINNIDNGKRELSPGYECDLLLQSGTYKGERYDAIQVKRDYNHLALCDKARGGEDISLNLDSKEAENIDGYELSRLDEKENNDSLNFNQRSRFMGTYKLDGIEYNADKQVINHLDRQEEALKTAEAEKETLQGKLDSVTEELDKFKKRNLDAEVAEAVSKRREFESRVSKHLDEKEVEKLPKLKEDEIKKTVILKAFPEAKLDDRSDEYITARFDSAVELLDKEKKEDGIKKQRRVVNNDNHDSGNDILDAEEARKKMLKRDSELWKEDSEK